MWERVKAAYQLKFQNEKNWKPMQLKRELFDSSFKSKMENIEMKNPERQQYCKFLHNQVQLMRTAVVGSL